VFWLDIWWIDAAAAFQHLPDKQRSCKDSMHPYSKAQRRK
jgi:hypothetical protein